MPAALTMMPVVPLARIAAKPQVPSIVRDFVIVTVPKLPGSSTSISPPSAVFESAPAKVLHGAVRLPGLTSSPTPDTHVRVAGIRCASNQRARVRWMLEKDLYDKTFKNVNHLRLALWVLR